MNDPITTITYWILWAGVAWCILHMIRVTALELMGLRP
jgi:hypothetical protein